MFTSIFKNISKPFGGGASQSTDDQTGSPGRRSDRVDDGFLLVGNTASERTTVHGGTFRGDLIDAPPSYGNVNFNPELPSYTAYKSNTQVYSPTIDVSRQPEYQHGNPMQTGSTTIQTGSWNQGNPQENPTNDRNFHTDSQTRTAISDVPFVIQGGIGSHSLLMDLKNSNILYQHTFDASHYEYDFSLEMNFLCDHGGFQENNVDMDIQ